MCPNICVSERLCVRTSVCPNICVSECLCVRTSVCPNIVDGNLPLPKGEGNAAEGGSFASFFKKLVKIMQVKTKTGKILPFGVY